MRLNETTSQLEMSANENKAKSLEMERMQKQVEEMGEQIRQLSLARGLQENEIAKIQTELKQA